MTGFLASVNSLEEARIALAGGADVIDLKDPSKGVLGAAPLTTIRDVVKVVAGDRLISATVGDLPSVPAIVGLAVERTWACGVDIVKVGFFDTDNRALMATLGAQARKGTHLVAVLFADCEPDLGTLSDLADCGLTGVMLDTVDKRGGSLRNYRTDEELAAFVGTAKALGLMTGLAGSLKIADVAALLALKPDYLGFRGALCAHGLREDTLDPMAVRCVRTRIPLKPSKLKIAAIETERKPAGFESEENSHDAVASQES